MRIGVVTRNDTDRIGGGDAIMLHNIRRQTAPLGVDMQTIPMDDLEQFKGDALHLTQLYQLDVAEATLRHALSKRVPLFASPLVEEHLALWAYRAVRKPGKWGKIALVFGRRTAELAFQQWHTIRRARSKEWQRQRRILERAYLVPNSRYELGHLTHWFALSDPDASVVPLGVDPNLYGATSSSPKKTLIDSQNLPERYILQVGVISMRKNQGGLLRALMDVDLPIVFLGRPSPYEPEYFQEVIALAHERENVIFLDSLADREMPTLYRRAALHILPSWSERPGLVTLEAAACGCKVISTERAPIHDYLADRAWYCEPGNPSSIRRAVQEALEQPIPPDLSSFVLSQFTWQRTAERLRDVYLSALGT